jgi:hypothetical protein
LRTSCWSKLGWPQRRIQYATPSKSGTHIGRRYVVSLLKQTNMNTTKHPFAESQVTGSRQGIATVTEPLATARCATWHDFAVGSLFGTRKNRVCRRCLLRRVLFSATTYHCRVLVFAVSYSRRPCFFFSQVPALWLSGKSSALGVH